MAAEHNEILSRELSHRIKNIFAVVTGLVSLSGRREPASAGFAAKLVDRIMALGRAHEFARPHSERSRPQHEEETLAGMLGQILAPYYIDDNPRIRIAGDEVHIDDQSATPLALIFHELATNAAKYGALANEGGRVDLNIANDGSQVRIDWQEHGGPVVAGAPEHSGFGSRLAEMSATQQLGGRIARDWRPEGLHVALVIPVDRLRRR
jgi:two-component sensor histidine kinase